MDLLEVDRAPAEEEPHRLADGRRVDRGDAQPATGADLDHALGDERSHGFAYDGARDAELLAELAPEGSRSPTCSRRERIVSSIFSATLSDRRGSRVTWSKRASGAPPVPSASTAAS